MFFSEKNTVTFRKYVDGKNMLTWVKVDTEQSVGLF